MATPLDRIKILEPRHPNRSTGIINGRTSGILNWNDIPYPSFYRAYKELSTNFWIPDEVDMKGDAKQYGELSAREKNAYDSIIGLLATLDSPQTRFIYNVAEYITDPAAHANAAIIAQARLNRGLQQELMGVRMIPFASQAERDYLFDNRSFTTIYEQKMLSGYVTGDLFELPAGAVGVEIALGSVEGHDLLKTHHDRIGKPAHQHDERQDDVHDADLLVIDGGQPFAPEVSPEAIIGERADRSGAADHDDCESRQNDRIRRDRTPVEATEKKRGGMVYRSHTEFLSELRRIAGCLPNEREKAFGLTAEGRCRLLHVVSHPGTRNDGFVVEGGGLCGQHLLQLLDRAETQNLEGFPTEDRLARAPFGIAALPGRRQLPHHGFDLVQRLGEVRDRRHVHAWPADLLRADQCHRLVGFP